MVNTKKVTIKSCESCTFYMQHYRIDRFFIKSVNCGHCTKLIHKKVRPCKSWTEKKDNTTEKELALKQILKKISDKLEKICLVINNKVD